MFIDFNGAMIEIGLQHMEEYLEVVAISIEDKQNEFDSYIELEAEKLDKDDKDAFYEWHSDEYWRLNDVFPNFLYKSFIISWYSFIENELFNFCNILKKQNNVDLSHKDLADNGIKQAKRYLQKVIVMNLRESDWEEFAKIGKIRNTLVHRNGDFKTEEIKNMKSYLEKHKLLENNGFEKFVPNEEFCKYLIVLAKNFFANLYFDAGRTTSRTSFEKR